MTFKIGKTSDHASRKVTVLLYGQNGTGKTYFASTFPHPVFLVPVIASNEMKTIAGFDLPVLTFDSMEDFKRGLAEVSKQIKNKTLDCKTLVVDNVTTIQLMFEDELKESKSVDKLEWEQWGKFKSYFVSIMKTLHSWPINVIWITHTHHENVFSLLGDSKHFIPNNCDLILYAEARDPGGNKDTQFIVHAKRFGNWPARIRRDMTLDLDMVKQFGPDPSPHFDDLAPYLGLGTREEEEAR
jgi:hypothetical protein